LDSNYAILDSLILPVQDLKFTDKARKTRSTSQLPNRTEQLTSTWTRIRQTMTPNDATEVQNKESIVEVELETVVKQAMDQFDNVASVTVAHLVTYNQLKTIHITVYTGEADSVEDHLGLFDDDHRITIERGDEKLLVPFSVYATFDGPVTWDSVEQTTIHIDQSVLGAKPVQLEDGLAYVRDKLEKPGEWDRDRRDSISLDRVRNYTV
jgi:hypothetical protein